MKKLILSLLLISTSVHSGIFLNKKDRPKEHENTQVIEVDGRQRTYHIHTPKLDTEEYRKPLVIVFHGGGGNGKNVEKMTRFSDLADKEGFYVAYPNGSGFFSKKLLTWNATHCCGYALKNVINDTLFVSKLIDDIESKYPIDTSRIFLTGISNGAMMSHKIGILLSDKIAGIAPVAGGMFGDEPVSNNPVPALIINGSLDKSIPIKGGLTDGKFKKAWDGTPLKPVSYQAKYWESINNCTGKFTINNDIENVKKITYECPENTPVMSVVVDNNAHAWPSGEKGRESSDTPSTSYNATKEIWNFFNSLQD